MPVEQTTVVTITCDNPDCPGNELDAHDRAGWTFVTSEVYGDPSRQHVYCCPACAGTISVALEEAQAAPMPA